MFMYVTHIDILCEASGSCTLIETTTIGSEEANFAALILSRSLCTCVGSLPVLCKA